MYHFGFDKKLSHQTICQASWPHFSRYLSQREETFDGKPLPSCSVQVVSSDFVVADSANCRKFGIILAYGRDVGRLWSPFFVATFSGLDEGEATSSVRWMLEALELRRSDEWSKTLMEWVQRRAKKEPVQYILGSWPFYPLPKELVLRAPVLIPRPETEELVNRIIDQLQKMPPRHIVDFGSGSGAIIVSLLHSFRDAHGVAVDPNPEAIALTEENALRCGVRDRLRLFHGTAKDFGEELVARKYDLIVSNPPYIPSREIPELQPDVRDFEDHKALDGGYDGLDVVIEILNTARVIGEPGARLYFELHHTHPEVFESQSVTWMKS